MSRTMKDLFFHYSTSGMYGFTCEWTIPILRIEETSPEPYQSIESSMAKAEGFLKK
ncbi:hypothetical protein [Melghirimyces algeriensis]|uniref:hypothetical protein n=1 Tax=Melghirimyces algeriensis TaxID=910412 RepID=UPI00163DE2CF|nr:hypothetical protein [Melghirimyces algeriensis]